MRARIRSQLAAEGIELCHIAWRPGARRGILTLFVDRPGGVSLDDCERASRLTESVLDTDERGGPPGAYVLEVSSPGLDRPLWELEDCVKFLGRRVRVTLSVPADGTRHLKGALSAVNGDELVVVDEDRSRSYTFRFGDVKLARLIPEY